MTNDGVFKKERIRKPQVRMTYEVGGCSKELPFVVGVLSDLCGKAKEPPKELRERQFLSIDRGSFDDVLKRLNPRLDLRVANTAARDDSQLRIELEFERLDDFRPERIVQQVDPLRQLLGLRNQLHDLVERPNLLVEGQLGFIQRTFEHLIRERLEASASTVSTVKAWILSIDRQLSEQVNEIMHAPEFQKLEAAWRGLYYLVVNTETSESLQIKVLNVSKEDLIKDFDIAPEPTSSTLWKWVHDYEYSEYRTDPFGLLVGDYEFGKSAREVKLLEDLARVAAASHAPFIAPAAPEMFGMDSFTELQDPRDLKRLFDKSDPRNIKWLSFRDCEDSRFAGLCLPRILMRAPYGTENPVQSFSFEEDVAGDHFKYLWGNAAYPFVSRITDSFAKYHWFGHICGPEGGGLVSGLPTYLDQRWSPARKCAAEVHIWESREHELSDLGFNALLQRKNSDEVAFFGASSVQKPKVYNTDYATANAKIMSQLEYLFVTCRIAHYLKSICLVKSGGFMSPEEAEMFLNKWVDCYVLDLDNATDAEKAERPLRKARIEVRADPRRPGCHKAVAYLVPWNLGCRINVALMLVVELPPPAKRSGA